MAHGTTWPERGCSWRGEPPRPIWKHSVRCLVHRDASHAAIAGWPSDHIYSVMTICDHIYSVTTYVRQ